MSTNLALNALLSLPQDFQEELKVGGVYKISKSGYRVLPYEVPMELSTHDHKYLGKVVVKEILVKDSCTNITFEVLKLFSDEESKVFTDNFIKVE